MEMDAMLWMLLPLFVASGTALLVFYLMQARLEVAIARERQSLAEARAIIDSHQMVLDDRVKTVEETVRRKALEEFMQELRIEERSFMRETTSMFNTRKMMVIQERLYFRNIPLSNWVEHEMLLEEGAEHRAPGSFAMSGCKSIQADARTTLSKLLQDCGPAIACRNGVM
jgi:hypothetical protein